MLKSLIGTSKWSSLWRIVCLLFFLLFGFRLFATDTNKIKNVIVIIGDDHATTALGCYGNTYIKTPNLDKLAKQGVRFSSAFANCPMCSASRQSLLTGKYPHAAGVTLLNTSFSDDQQTIAEYLKSKGFATGYVGKMHFNNNLSHGFDYRIKNSDWQNFLKNSNQPKLPVGMNFRPVWKPFNDPAEIWLNSDMLSAAVYDRFDVGTYYARKANEFIAQNKDHNFCLWVGFHEPHSPFNFPIEYVNSYHPDSVRFPSGSQEDDRWIPAIFKNLTEEQKRGIIASYYTSVEYLDKNVGLILDKTEELGLSDETMIIYIGDHGYLLNDHKRFEKHMMWEEAVGAPLIIKPGNQFTKDTVIAELTEFVDLAPTIFDELEIEQMEGLQGKSLVPLFNQTKKKLRDYAFSVYYPDNKAMLRSKDYKYIFTTGKKDLTMGYYTGLGASGIMHRLYDLNADRYETRNIADEPEYASILQEYQETLVQKFQETHPFADYIPENLSLEQKLIWYCEPVEDFKICVSTNNYPKLLAAEQFDYTTQKSLLEMEPGGKNWEGNWENAGNLSTNKVLIVPGSLSSSGIKEEGAMVKLEYLNDNTQIRISRELKYPLVSNDNEYWLCFYMSTEEGSAKNNVANLMLVSDNNSQQIAFGRIYGSGKLGVVTPPDNKSWKSEFNDIGTNYFVVKFSTSCNNTNDSVYVWINPSEGIKPKLKDATIKLQTTVLGKGINKVWMKCEGAGNNQIPHTVFFDDISIAQSFEALSGAESGRKYLKKPDDKFSIYPNPVKDELKIEFETKSPRHAELIIVDVGGNITIHKELGQIKGGLHLYDLKLSNNLKKGLTPGIYTLCLKLDDQQLISKFIYE